jgi:hypothetical protein
MAQYDTRDLAAYLRKARDPISGYQPSFTDADPGTDRADPFAFDVRSAEEVGLGKHIDPVIGAADPAAIDPIAERVSAWTPPEKYGSSEEVLKALRDTEREQEQLVQASLKAAEEQTGVPQARAALQEVAYLGANHPIYQQYALRYQSAKEAAGLTFGVVNGDQLIGTKASKFSPYEARYGALEDRLAILTREEAKKDQVEGEIRRHELQAGARVAKDKLSDALGSIGISEAMEKRLKDKGIPLARQDVIAASLSSERIKFLQKVGRGQHPGDALAVIAGDPANADDYIKIITADMGEEDTERVTRTLGLYRDTSTKVHQMTDKDLYKDNPKEYEDLLRMDKTTREDKIAAKRANAINLEIKTITNQVKLGMYDDKNTSLANDPNFTPIQQAASGAINSAFRDVFGTSNLADIYYSQKDDPREFITKMIAARRIYARTLPGETEVFSGILHAMLKKMVSNMNMKGAPLGISVAPGEDEVVTGFFQFVPVWFDNLTFGG